MIRLLERLTEVIGWCGIVISPLLIGGFIGAFIYLNNKNAVGLVLGLSHTLAGLWVGILLANRAWKSAEGTVGLLTGVRIGNNQADTTQPK